MSKQLIVITGASSGIGEAIARKLSAAGHPLLLLAVVWTALKRLGCRIACVKRWMSPTVKHWNLRYARLKQSSVRQIALSTMRAHAARADS